MTDTAAAPSTLQSALPGLLAKAKVVISPYPFGLSDDDNLRITTVNAVIGVTLEVHYRLLTKSGEVKAGVFKQTPGNSRVAATVDFHLAGGYVTNLSVFATAGNTKVGQTFVIVQLIRGLGSVAIVLGTMLQGYVTTTQGLGWPGSPIQSSTEGEPVVRLIVGTQPAAGNDISESVPTGARWELLTVQCNLIIGAAGIALPVVMTLDDGANTYASSITGNSGGANTVNQVVWSQNVQQITASVVGGVLTLAPMTANKMLAGHRFLMHSLLGPANVQWASPVYIVREWQEVP